MADHSHMNQVGGVDEADIEQISADVEIASHQSHYRDEKQIGQDNAFELLAPKTFQSILFVYDYVRFIVSRKNCYTSLLYKDDPTIMAWQIGNEPRAFSPSSPTEARNKYYQYIFSLIDKESLISGCNFWAWGGEARPNHEQWLPGDPYLGGPAQEQQGLNSVFNCDTTTLQVISSWR